MVSWDASTMLVVAIRLTRILMLLLFGSIGSMKKQVPSGGKRFATYADGHRRALRKGFCGAWIPSAKATEERGVPGNPEVLGREFGRRPALQKLGPAFAHLPGPGNP